MTAGSGLTGGGTIAATRTINVGAGSGITVNANDVAVDSTVIRTTGNFSLAGAITFNGTVNFRGAIDLADNDILRFGTGDDVEMFFTGSDFVMDVNNGEDFLIRDGNSGNATRFTFNVDNGDATAVTWIATSDARLKDEVSERVPGLEAVLRMRPMAFRWKERKLNRNGGSSLGFIAQEMQRVVPEVVSYSEKRDVYGIDYGKLVPVLVQTIQEMAARIDVLESA